MKNYCCLFLVYLTSGSLLLYLRFIFVTCFMFSTFHVCLSFQGNQTPFLLLVTSASTVTKGSMVCETTHLLLAILALKGQPLSPSS